MNNVRASRAMNRRISQWLAKWERPGLDGQTQSCGASVIVGPPALRQATMPPARCVASSPSLRSQAATPWLSLRPL